MAERTAIFNLKVEDGNSAKKVADAEKALQKFKKAALEADKGTGNFQKRLQSINKVVEKNAFTLGEANRLIENYQTIAFQAGKESAIGKEAIAKAAQLTDQMSKLRSETTNLSNDGKNLQGAMQLGQGVLGGYQAFAGVTAMLGVENEALMDTMMHLHSVQQVSMGLESARKTLEEGTAARRIINIAQTKALAIGTTAYAGAQNLLNLAVGKGSKIMKIFRLALISTGIGALVVGIGLLIANFDKVIGVVQQARDWFNELGDGFKTVISIVLPFIGLIRLIGAGLEALGIIESDQDREREKQHQQQIARLKKEGEDIDKKISKMRDEHKEFEENGNFQIRMMKAQGASKEEIFKAEQKLRKETIRQNIALAQQLAARNALTVAERDAAKARGEIKKANKLDDQVKERNKDIRALNKANRDFRKDIKVEDAKFKTEQEKAEEQHQENLSKTRSDAREKDEDDAEKLEQEKENKLAEIRRTAEDFMIQSIEDEGLRKQTALRTQHERERAQLKKKFGEDTELLKELKAHQQDQVIALQKDLDSKNTEDEKLKAQREREKNMLKLENDLMQLELDGEETLNKELEIARARRDALLAEENLSEEEKLKIKLEYAAKEAEINKKKKDDEDKTAEAIKTAKQGVADSALSVLGDLASVAKEGSATAKALALAEITAQTAMGFVRGLAIAQQGAAGTGFAAPFTMPLFYGAQIASVLGAANKARGILGGGGSVSAPPASPAPPAGGSDDSQGGDGSVNTRQDAEGRSTDGKVFVSETDISRTQDRVNQINVRSSF